MKLVITQEHCSSRGFIPREKKTKLFGNHRKQPNRVPVWCVVITVVRTTIAASSTTTEISIFGGSGGGLWFILFVTNSRQWLCVYICSALCINTAHRRGPYTQNCLLLLRWQSRDVKITASSTTTKSRQSRKVFCWWQGGSPKATPLQCLVGGSNSTLGGPSIKTRHVMKVMI